jgi:4-carboxymuconolactone decarboxylase
MISSLAPGRVAGPGTDSVRCGPRDQYRPRQKPLTQAIPLPRPCDRGDPLKDRPRPLLFARSFWPPLTTIRQDFAEVGRLSIRKLLRKVSGAAAGNDKTTVPTELIVRNSTGRPPAEGSGRRGARMPGGVDARADQSADVREGPVSEKLPARLDLVAPAELAPAQRALYDAITGGPRASQAGTVPIADEDGRLLGPFAIMLLSPEVGNAMQQVGAKIRFDTALTGRERELAILTVAGALDSEFERLAHVPAARGLGLTEPQIDAALAGRTAAGLSADEAMASRLALAMTVDRTLSDRDYSDGVEALGRPRLAELTWLVGYYSALALSLAVFRPVLPESFSDGR